MLMYTLTCALLLFLFDELRFRARRPNLSRELAQEAADREWAAYKEQHGWIGD